MMNSTLECPTSESAAFLKLPVNNFRDFYRFSVCALARWMRYISGAALFCMTGIAVAEDEISEKSRVPLPADNYAVSPGGVDMRTGQFVYQREDLTIGGENGSLWCAKMGSSSK